MGEVFHAIGVFFEQLAAVKFTALGLAVLTHILKTMCTSRAWRNTIAAAYPDEQVPWRQIYASYLAGVGVNAIIPARTGDAVRLYLAHRAVPGSTYTTLASTLITQMRGGKYVAIWPKARATDQIILPYKGW